MDFTLRLPVPSPKRITYRANILRGLGERRNYSYYFSAVWEVLCRDASASSLHGPPCCIASVARAGPDSASSVVVSVSDQAAAGRRRHRRAASRLRLRAVWLPMSTPASIHACEPDIKRLVTRSPAAKGPPSWRFNRFGCPRWT